MPESVENWWARRQRTKGAEVPYPIGSYRSDWARFPALIRQYHPDRNGFITLTQIPPAAEVWLVWQCESGHEFVATPAEQRDRPGLDRRRSTWCPQCSAGATGRDVRLAKPIRPRPTSRRPPLGHMAVGDAFVSEAAPKPASAAEGDLRSRLSARLEVDLTPNAIRVRQPFHGRLEVWPDIPIAELRVALEYDTVGRSATEHVGQREASDRAKDRLLRQVGWEVVRIRCSKLEPLGPFDLRASGVTSALIDRLLDRLREIRGDLIVDAYLRRPSGSG